MRVFKYKGRPFFRSYSSLVHRHIQPFNTPFVSYTSLSYTLPLLNFKFVQLSLQPCLLHPLPTILLQFVLQMKNGNTLGTIRLFHLFKMQMKSTHPNRFRLFLISGSQKHLLQFRRLCLFLKPGCQKYLLQPNLSITWTIANTHPMFLSKWTIPNFHHNLVYTSTIPLCYGLAWVSWKGRSKSFMKW